MRKIAALLLILVSSGSYLPKCTETLSPTWTVLCRKTIVLDEDADKNYILLTIKRLKSSHDVTSGQATQFPVIRPAADQLSRLLAWRPAEQHEVVRSQEARQVNVVKLGCLESGFHFHVLERSVWSRPKSQNNTLISEILPSKPKSIFCRCKL